MGYYYDAKYSIEYSEAQLVSMSLDIKQLQEMLDTEPYAWKIDAESIVVNSSSNNSIENILEELGWENDSKNTKEGKTVLLGYASSSKYNGIVPVLNRWMGKHGVGLAVKCYGEDGENWTYQNAYGESNFKEEKLVDIEQSSLVRYQKIESMLGELIQKADDYSAVDISRELQKLKSLI